MVTETGGCFHPAQSERGWGMFVARTTPHDYFYFIIYLYILFIIIIIFEAWLQLRRWCEEIISIAQRIR